MQLSFFAGELAEGGMQQDQCGKIITENIPYSDNKLASLGATLVRNYDPLTHLLTDRGKV